MERYRLLDAGMDPVEVCRELSISADDLRRAGMLRTTDSIRTSLEAEFDKFTIWPDEADQQRVA